MVALGNLGPGAGRLDCKQSSQGRLGGKQRDTRRERTLHSLGQAGTGVTGKSEDTEQSLEAFLVSRREAVPPVSELLVEGGAGNPRLGHYLRNGRTVISMLGDDRGERLEDAPALVCGNPVRG